MASIEYSLFRAKFVKPIQVSLFTATNTPRDLFLSALSERPSAELRKGYTWHIGNIKYFSETAGYFAVGRTTDSTIEKFDEETGDFLEVELTASPYTHCVFDAALGILGIAKKSILAESAKGIAHRIEQLLSMARSIIEANVAIEIHPIPDPEGFLRAISSAYKVSRFAATFHGPNPFDADEHFQKPLSVYLQAAGGAKGKAQIQGDDLNRDVLAEVTRSTAATGNEASARILKSRNQAPVTINLRGDPIKRSYDENKHHPNAVLNDLTETYNRVRHDERD
jgi:hypothetical protein